MQKSITTIALFFTITGLLFFQGCSSSGNSLGTTAVYGTITLDGVAVEGVNVNFIPTGSEGRESYGITDAQGKFVLTVPGADAGSGAIPGEYRVTFSKMSDPLEGLEHLEGEELDAEVRKRFPRGLPPAKHLLPEKYASRTATDIAPVKVERGKRNNFTFELKSQ